MCTIVPVISLNCVYGHQLPLGNIDRAFVPGNLYGVSGANGAGKSTLLLTIAGELEPIEGDVRVNDVDPASTAGAGLVARIAEPTFYPDLTVGEHLKLMAKSGGMNYDNVVEVWRLEDLLNATPSALSSGQRQRMFLGIQLTTPCDVLVLDEPERHLDKDWVEFLCEVLIDIARSGSVVIVASHSPIVLASCDEVLELQ